MYEVVKVVKGYEITRMKGSRGMYHVIIRKFQKGYVERVFQTIKAATAYIEKEL